MRVTHTHTHQESELTWGKLESCLVDGFIPALLTALKKQLKKQAGGGKGAISSVTVSAREAAGGGAREAGEEGPLCYFVFVLFCLLCWVGGVGGWTEQCGQQQP